MRREAFFEKGSWFKDQWTDLAIYAIRADERAARGPVLRPRPSEPPDHRTAPERRSPLPALTGLRVLAAAWVVLFHYRPDLEALAPWTVAGRHLHAGRLPRGRPVLPPEGLHPGLQLRRRDADLLLAAPPAPSSGTGSPGSGRCTSSRSTSTSPWRSRWAPSGVGEGGHRRTPAAYGQNVLMVHNWFNDRPSFNGPAWSIASEWFAYLLAPLLFVLVARVVRARTSVLLAGLSYAAMLAVFAVFALPNGNLEHMFYVRIMGEFVAGMFLCLAWVRGGLALGRLAPLLPVVVAGGRAACRRWRRVTTGWRRRWGWSSPSWRLPAAGSARGCRRRSWWPRGRRPTAST